MASDSLTHEPWYQECKFEIMRYLNDYYGREYRFNDHVADRSTCFEEWIVYQEKEKLSVVFMIRLLPGNKKATITVLTKKDQIDFFIKQK